MFRNRYASDVRRNGRNGAEEDLRDLGFGSRVSEESVERLLNRDGSFNVERTGLSFGQSLNLYHSLLTMSWLRFHVVLILGYILINALFALVFVLCGPDSLSGFNDHATWPRFLQAFFFSVQTFTTVGYGAMSPINLAADIAATFDAFVGLLSFALATGLLFARFSRPTARILYSDVAVIGPYRDLSGFMFRIANQRRSQLIEVEVKVLFSRIVQASAGKRREYHMLKLEREKVVFFPLHWTVVHPIDSTSPLAGLTDEDLRSSRAEFLILLTAIDDTFSQTVHSRTSYHFNEVVWNARFADPFQRDESGSIQVDLKTLHVVERVG